MHLDWCTKSQGLETLKNIKCPSNQTIFEKKKKKSTIEHHQSRCSPWKETLVHVRSRNIGGGTKFFFTKDNRIYMLAYKGYTNKPRILIQDLKKQICGIRV